jgi:F0F1-type ATP synthase membrane subunit b/b'
MALRWPPNIKKTYTKLGKLTRFKRYRLFIILVILIIISVGAAIKGISYFAKQKESTGHDCSSVVNSINQALNDENLSQAASLLKDNEKACTDSKDKVSSMIFNSEYAVVAYKTGEKEKAKSYAERALELARSLSSADRAEVINFEGILITVNDIKNGHYDDLGGLY